MTRRFWYRLLTNGIGYVLCVLACTYVVQFTASEMAKVMYRLKFPFAHVESRDVLDFYTENWLLFNVISGVACGSAIYSVWRNAVATLVWVPSFCLLCQKILTRPHSVLWSASVSSDISYFFSTGCREISAFDISQRCADQLNYSLPFYAGVGFSVGTFLSMLYWKRRERFIDSSSPPDSSSDSSGTIDEHHHSPENHRSSEQ
jgi:hypothetical protein